MENGNLYGINLKQYPKNFLKNVKVFYPKIRKTSITATILTFNTIQNFIFYTFLKTIK